MALASISIAVILGYFLWSICVNDPIPAPTSMTWRPSAIVYILVAMS